MTDMKLPELVGTLAALPEQTKRTIRAYGEACARVAKQAVCTGGEVEAIAKHIENKADEIGEKHGHYEKENYGLVFKDSRQEDDYDLLNALADEIRECFSDGIPAPVSVEQEPIGYMCWSSVRIAIDDYQEGYVQCDSTDTGSDCSQAIPVYAHPAPVAAVPDKLTVSQCAHSKYAEGWNDCVDTLTSTPQPVGDNDWVDVKDRLPEPKTMCFVWTGTEPQVCYFTPNSKFAITALYGTPVTHWKPAIKPPEGEQ